MAKMSFREIQIAEKLEKIFNDISRKENIRAKQRLNALKTNGYSDMEFRRLFRRIGLK